MKLYIHKDEHGKWHGKALRAALDACPPGQYAVEIKRHSGRKTTPQNDFLHVLCRVAANEMNAAGLGDGKAYTVDSVKELLKRVGVYPLVDCVLPDGEIIQVPKRTRDLDKEETQITIDRALAWFAEYGIITTMPGEQMEMIPG